MKSSRFHLKVPSFVLVAQYVCTDREEVNDDPGVTAVKDAFEATMKHIEGYIEVKC